MAVSCWYVDAQWSHCLLGSAVTSVWRERGEKEEESLFQPFVLSLKRCLGTTKQRLMDTWTSWRRPRGRTWTLRMRMAWLPPYWLLSMDMSMLFSSYAAESKHSSLLSITCASSHIQYSLNKLLKPPVYLHNYYIISLNCIEMFQYPKESMSSLTDPFGYIVTLRHRNIYILMQIRLYFMWNARKRN